MMFSYHILYNIVKIIIMFSYQILYITIKGFGLYIIIHLFVGGSIYVTVWVPQLSEHVEEGMTLDSAPAKTAIDLDPSTRVPDKSVPVTSNRNVSY